MLREENGSRKYGRNERGQEEVTTVLRYGGNLTLFSLKTSLCREREREREISESFCVCDWEEIHQLLCFGRRIKRRARSECTIYCSS